MEPDKITNAILDEFWSAGWFAAYTNSRKIIKVQPSIGHYKHYFLVQTNQGDWMLGGRTQTLDPEYDEAQSILKRARVQLRDRATNSRTIAPNKLLQYRGNMANIVRIDYNQFINFDYILKITSCIDGSNVKCIVYWNDGVCSDTFEGEQAKKIIGMAELMAIAALNNLQIEDEGEPL